MDPSYGSARNMHPKLWIGEEHTSEVLGCRGAYCGLIRKMQALMHRPQAQGGRLKYHQGAPPSLSPSPIIMPHWYPFPLSPLCLVGLKKNSVFVFMKNHDFREFLGPQRSPKPQGGRLKYHQGAPPTLSPSPIIMPHWNPFPLSSRCLVGLKKIPEFFFMKNHDFR